MIMCRGIVSDELTSACFSRGPAAGPRVHHHHHRLWPALLLHQLRAGGGGAALLRRGLPGPGPLHGGRLPGPGARGRPADIQPLPGLPGPLSGPPLPWLGPRIRSGQSNIPRISQLWLGLSLRHTSELVCFCPHYSCLWSDSLNGALCGLSVMTRPLSPGHHGQANIWGILHFTLILSVNSSPGWTFPPPGQMTRRALILSRILCIDQHFGNIVIVCSCLFS